MPLPAFRFKKFRVEQAGAAHPVGTDAVLLGAWADIRNVTSFLDIGTGTGVIALMLAQRLSARSGDFRRSNTAESANTPLNTQNQAWKGTAVELHAPSSALARSNFAESAWADHLSVWEGAIQQFLGRDLVLNNAVDKAFDLIVSNPPFFSERTVSPDKTRSLGRHTETLSFEDLLSAVDQLLAPKGKFCAILPEREGRRLCELGVPSGLFWTRIVEVRSRPGKLVERLLLQFERSPYGIQREEICLFEGEKGNQYSEAFRELTRDFYLGA
jgi:tRNA1Val (adenine37-N6)-methyltransferase